jgi:hypothetical protein
MHSDETIHQRGTCLTATRLETEHNCPKIPSGPQFRQPEIAQSAARQTKVRRLRGSIPALSTQATPAPALTPQPHNSAFTKQQLPPQQHAEHRIRVSDHTHDPCNSRHLDADNHVSLQQLSTIITTQHSDDVPDKSRPVVPERDALSLNSDTKTLTFPTWSRQRCTIASVSSLAPGDTSNSLDQETEVDGTKEGHTNFHSSVEERQSCNLEMQLSPGSSPAGDGTYSCPRVTRSTRADDTTSVPRNTHSPILRTRKLRTQRYCARVLETGLHDQTKHLSSELPRAEFWSTEPWSKHTTSVLLLDSRADAHILPSCTSARVPTINLRVKTYTKRTHASLKQHKSTHREERHQRTTTS